MSLSKTPIIHNKGYKSNIASVNLDDEWAQFVTNSVVNSVHNTSGIEDDACEGELDDLIHPYIKDDAYDAEETENWYNVEAPQATPIYISTKSKIAFLEKPIDLSLFWDIPVLSYHTAKNGVIKKQIKVNSKTAEELEIIKSKLSTVPYYDEHIMTHIDNPSGRVKFKDIRKITIGISKKDIMSYRSKKKQAFYNCFVMILRLDIEGTFKEFHIKVFNTGKIEIPGIQNDAMYQLVLKTILDILQPLSKEPLVYQSRNDTVLINSNFNCGFFIKREVLYDILKNKYNLQAIYDPCSYPGIQCKFCYKNGENHIGTIQSGVQFTTEEQNNEQPIEAETDTNTELNTDTDTDIKPQVQLTAKAQKRNL